MAITDIFRPKWRHSDPTVRADAVRKLETGETEKLVRVLQSDADVAVRRIAVKKLEDPDVLTKIAQDDPDESLRRLAQDKLSNLWVALALSDDAQASQHALEKIADARALALVAQNSTNTHLQRRALDRITDQKVLVDVVRKLREPALRLAVLERIRDEALLRAIALDDSRELALTAIERISDRDALEELSRKAKNKAVRTRAKRRISLSNVQPVTQQTADDIERKRRAQRLQLCLTAESYAWSTDWSAASTAIEQAKRTWEVVGGEAEPELADRFLKAIQQYALREAQHADEVAMQERAATRRDEESRRHRAQQIVDESQQSVDASSADDMHEDDVEDEEPEAQDELVAKKPETLFDATLVRAHVADSPERDRVFELCYGAEGAIAEKNFDETYLVIRELDPLFHQLLEAGGVDQALADRYQDIFTRFTSLRHEQKDLRAKQVEQNLKRVTGVLEQLASLAGSKDLRRIERTLAEAGRIFRKPGPMPAATPLNDYRHQYEEARKTLFAAAQELKEVDDWKRWANIQPRIDICKQIEALAENTDDREVFRRLRDLERDWKKSGHVPRDRAEELHQRFKAACDKLEERRQAHLKVLEGERDGNLTQKETLCARAEELANSTEWEDATAQFKALQEDWKAVGPVPRVKADELWQRFRTACDKFFERRRQYLETEDVGRNDNLKVKEELCVRAEKWAESSEWERASAEFRDIQRDWHQVGPVPRNEAKTLWRRYRKARELFFKRRRQGQGNEAAPGWRERHDLWSTLQGLCDWGFELPHDEVVKQVVAVQSNWAKLEPMPPGRARGIEGRFIATLARVVDQYRDHLSGTELDPVTSRSRRERLCERLEKTISTLTEQNAAPAATETTDVADMADKLRTALAENALGTRRDPDEDWHHAFDELHDMRANWVKLAPLPGEEGKQLQQRFDSLADQLMSRRPPKREPTTH